MQPTKHFYKVLIILFDAIDKFYNMKIPAQKKYLSKKNPREK